MGGRVRPSDGALHGAWEHLVGARLPHLSDDRVAATTQACLGTVFSVSAWPARALRVGDADAVEELVLGLLHEGLSET